VTITLIGAAGDHVAKANSVLGSARLSELFECDRINHTGCRI